MCEFDPDFFSGTENRRFYREQVTSNLLQVKWSNETVCIDNQHVFHTIYF